MSNEFKFLSTAAPLVKYIVDIGHITNKLGQIKMGKGKNGEEFDYRPKAAKLCKEYLGGPWKHVTKDNIVLKRIRLVSYIKNWQLSR